MANHILFLTEKEIESLAKHCKAGLKMAEDSEFFKKLAPELNDVLEKLEKKKAEIDDGQ